MGCVSCLRRSRIIAERNARNALEMNTPCLECHENPSINPFESRDTIFGTISKDGKKMPLPCRPHIPPAGAVNPNLASNQSGAAAVARVQSLRPDVSRMISLAGPDFSASGVGASADANSTPYYKQPLVLIGALIGTGALIGLVSAVRSRKVASAKKPA